MKTYSTHQLAMLEQIAVQLGECDRLLDMAKVPLHVIIGGRKVSATHLRLKWFIQQQDPKPKKFSWTFRFQLNPTVAGSVLTPDGQLLVWFWRVTFWRRLI